MVLCLSGAIAFKSGQAAVGCAIGVTHQEYTLRLVQQDGHAYLFEDEVTLEIVARRSQSLGAACYDDHVGTQDAPTLEKLVYGRADALVKAGEHGGVGDVGIRRGIEVKYLVHELLGSRAG